MKIDFLKNKPKFIENVAACWSKEWSRDKSGIGLDKQKNDVLAKANIGKIPFILIAFDGDNL